MPTAIEALAKDESGGGLTGELREHELCAFSYDSSDEPTEVIVLIKNEAGDESSKVARTSVSKSIGPLLNGSDSISAPPVMDNSPPPKNLTKTKRDFGLTDDNYDAKLTRQHVIQGAVSKENASPQKEVNTRTSFAPLGCTQAAFVGSVGGGSNNPSFCTLMNDVKDTSGKKARAGIEEAVVSGGSHGQAARGNAPNERDDDLFRDVKERGNATDTLMEETTSDESIRGDSRQKRELDEVKCETKSVCTSSSTKNDSLPTLSKRPRSDEESENGQQVKKRRLAKYRYQCSSEGCENHVVKGGVCWRHGAKANAKQCSREGCTNHVKKGGLCMRHGAKVKQCSSEGCTSNAKKGGLCKRHGAQVAWKQCSSAGCTKQAKIGGVCVSHGGKVKLCSSEGCTNHAKKGGLCMRHGAKVKLCSREGCTKQAKKGGVCIRHGRDDLA